MRHTLLVLITVWSGQLFANSLELSTSPERFREADRLYAERGDAESARAALEAYRRLAEKYPSDGDAAWRVSMACHFVAKRLVKDEDEQRKMFEEGREAGKRSIALVPACAACHFWTAINMALYGEVTGVFKSLFTLSEVEDHLKLAAQLEPGYAFGGPYRVMGAIEEKLPGILGGSNDRARTAYEKAIVSSPDEPLNYLFLARLLQKHFDDPARAREIAKRGLTFPIPSSERVESREGYQELVKFAESLGPAAS